MAANYGTIFNPLAAELVAQRKNEAYFEHARRIDNANYNKRLLQAQYSLSGDVFQEIAYDIASQGWESLAASVQGFMATLKATFERGYFPVLDNQINTNPTDKANNDIAYAYDPTLTDGTIAILQRLGRWGALRRQMQTDNQYIPANTITFGSLVAAGGNLGVTALGSITGSDHTLGGTLTLICVDDTVQAPKFSVINVLTNKLPDPTIPVDPTGQFSQITGSQQLQLLKSYQEGILGITMTLNLGALSITDPNALFSLVTVTTPSEADTNKGKIFIKITRQNQAGQEWLIQWYKDSAFTQLVTSTIQGGTVGTVAITLNGNGGTVVSATFSKANANTDMPNPGNTDTTVVWNIQTPRLNDQWTISITNNEAANLATKIGHRYRASLNSFVNAAPTLAAAGGGAVTVGVQGYIVTFVVSGTETCGSPMTFITVASGNQTINGSQISLGPAGTTARKVYRTGAGGTVPKLALTIGDNVTTTFSDTGNDAGLGAAIASTVIRDDLAASVSMT